MTQQTISNQPLAMVPDDCIAVAEIEYLLDTGRIDYIEIAGTPMVSLDGIRDYLRRHADLEQLERSELQPLLIDVNRAGSTASAFRSPNARRTTP